jgi:hypothetical protein
VPAVEPLGNKVLSVDRLLSDFLLPVETQTRSITQTKQLFALSVGALKGATHGRIAGGIFWFLGTLAPFGSHLCYSLSVTDPVGASV